MASEKDERLTLHEHEMEIAQKDRRILDLEARVCELTDRVKEMEGTVLPLEGELEELLDKINKNSQQKPAADNNDEDDDHDQLFIAQLHRNLSIGDVGAFRVAAALTHNMVITNLDLNECMIGDAGAEAVAELIRVNPYISWLRLTANIIQEKGGVALAEALSVNKTVLEINLGSTSRRYRNSFGPVGAMAFAKALKVNTTLTILGFGYNDVQDKGAIALAEALNYNKTLTFLRLADNNIGDAGAEALGRALMLRISPLKVLGLFHNRIGPIGASKLADALKQNDTLETLGIGRNRLGVEGTQYLLDALDYNDRLKNIDINTFSRRSITTAQYDKFKLLLEDRTRRRKKFVVLPTPSSVDIVDWKLYIKKVRHDRPPSESIEDLLRYGTLPSCRPYDVFLVKTGSQDAFLKQMRLHFQQNCFHTFLDLDMRDVDGPPCEQMRFAIETCRFVVCVISREFLTKTDPKAELEYAFKRMKWIEQNFGWRSLKVVLYNMSVKEYNDERKNQPSLPDLGNDMVLFEYSAQPNENNEGADANVDTALVTTSRRLFDSDEDLWDEIKTEMFRTDSTSVQAATKWKDFITRWAKGALDDALWFRRFTTMWCTGEAQKFPRAESLYSRTERLFA